MRGKNNFQQINKNIAIHEKALDEVLVQVFADWTIAT